MTQFATGTLRLSIGADTLVLGLRAAFGHGRGLCRLESEDDVRQRLMQRDEQSGRARSPAYLLGAPVFRYAADDAHDQPRADRQCRSRDGAWSACRLSGARRLGEAHAWSAVESVAPQRPMRRGGASALGGARSTSTSARSPATQAAPAAAGPGAGAILRDDRDFGGRQCPSGARRERSSPARCSSP